MSRTSLIALLFLFTPTLSFSQAGNVAFDHYTIDEGLSHNEIKSLVQDNDGYIWIGTKDGLNKFDGYNFKTYKSKRIDSTSIRGNVIFSLLINHEGTLLAATDEGLDYYDSDRDIFSPYPIKDEEHSLILNMSLSLYEDSNHGLWIGSRSGLVFLDPDTKVLKTYRNIPDDSSSLSGDFACCVFEDSRSNIWVGTDSGLNRFNPVNQTFIRYSIEQLSGKSSDVYFRSIMEDTDGSFWLGTNYGNLVKFYPDSGKYVKYQSSSADDNNLRNNYVSGISYNSRGEIIIATYREGLTIYNPASDKFTRILHNNLDAKSIISDNVFCLLEDRQNNLWVGTGNGLSCQKGAAKSFKHFTSVPQSKNSLSSNLVKSIYEDKEGNLWIGTKEGGLNKLNPERTQFTHFSHDSNDPKSIYNEDIYAILQDSHGELWFGGSEGLSRYDERSKTLTTLKYSNQQQEGMPSPWVYSMAEADEDHLWVGTTKGLNLVNKTSGETQIFISNPNDPRSLPDSRIISLYRDKLGYLWVGTAQGLSVLNEDGNSFTSYLPSDNPFSISNKLILVMYEDSKGRFWIGTVDGLNLFDKKLERFIHYTSNDGLGDDVINGICEDALGGLWISTNMGITRFDPDSMTFINFDEYDGLQSSHFFNGSYYKSESGEMFFGGINGFNSFMPEEIKSNSLLPPIVLTALTIADDLIKPGMKDAPINKHINKVDELVLNYNQRFFGLEFVALNFVNPNKNQYQFILEGFDKEWQQGTNLRSVRYTNVPHGKYVFKLTASNNDGLWNTKGKSLNIRIKQPLWLTWWAFVIYAILSILLLITIRRYSLIEANFKHKLMMEHFEKEKTEELNQLKMKFFTNISHELRTPLSLVIGPLERLLSKEDLSEEISSTLIVMHRNANRILRLMNQLIEFRKSDTGHLKLEAVKVDLNRQIEEKIQSFSDLSNQRNIELVFTSLQPEIEMYIDLEKFEKVLYNLLSNAFKFTGDKGKILIETSVVVWDTLKSQLGKKVIKSDYVCIKVSDNGQGIDPEQLDKIFERFYQGEQSNSNRNTGSGIGLALSKNLIKLHKGEIMAANNLEGGAVFTIYMPLGKKHLQKSEIDYPGMTQSPMISVIEDNREVEKAPIKVEGAPGNSKTLPKLLIVEDDLDVRQYMINDFTNSFNVIAATNGKEGLDKAKKEYPDIIISDVMMPEMDGIELCKKIKSNVLTSHIPVILLTARNSIEYQRYGLESGADDYVIKPFNLEILELKVRNLFESRQRLREEFKSKPSMPTQALKLVSADKKFLEKVVRAINQNMEDSNFSVEVLGNKVAMSRSNLYRKINALTGQTTIEFVRTIKLKEAARLLLENDSSVYDVMESTGFNDIKSFRKYFLSQYGCKPEDYFDFTEEMNESSGDEAE